MDDVWEQNNNEENLKIGFNPTINVIINKENVKSVDCITFLSLAIINIKKYINFICKIIIKFYSYNLRRLSDFYNAISRLLCGHLYSSKIRYIVLLFGVNQLK